MKTRKETKTQARNVCSLKRCIPTLQVILVLGLFLIPNISYGAEMQGNSNYSSVNVERLATAIKYAENSKKKPYGIMRDYCSAQTEAKCRKGCIQTIQKRLKLWDGSGDFINFLAKTYAPTSGKLRPAEKLLNPNWPSLVRHFYEKEISK